MTDQQKQDLGVDSAPSVGSFDGGWTLESAKPTKGRIKILSKRMPKYRSIIESAAEKYGIDADVIASVLAQESAFNPKAVGPKTRFGTAKGIAQFIDSTAKQYGSTGKRCSYLKKQSQQQQNTYQILLKNLAP